MPNPIETYFSKNCYKTGMNIKFFNMLRIEIPAEEYSGLTFLKLEHLDLPRPVNGFDSELNGNIILSFDNEEEAINYSYEMDRYAENHGDQSSPEYLAAIEIIKAISNDEFVQSYIQS
jgi:hypothetical protein